MKRAAIVDSIYVCVYQAALTAVFLKVVAPIYLQDVELAQTRNGQGNDTKIFLSYIFSIGAVALYRSIAECRKASRFVMLIQLLLIVIPFAVLYGQLNYPTWQMSIILLGFGGSILFLKALQIPMLPSLSQGSAIAVCLAMAAVTVYVYCALFATGGFERMNFDLSKVYDARADLSLHRFPLSGYFIPWVAYVANMALLSYFLGIRKKSQKFAWAGVIGVLLLQLLIFGMTNFKSFLFLPVAIVTLVVVIERASLFRSAVFGVLSAVACLALMSSSGSALSAGIIERVFYTPPALHSLYFGYFSVHPNGFLVDTVGGLFGSTYNESIVSVISEEYWGRLFSPNVGWIGDAFANFGVLGVISFAALLAIALNFADSFAMNRLPDGTVEGLLFGFAFGITNSALLTSLLTGGYFVAVVLLWSMDSIFRSGTHSVSVSGARR